MAQQPVRNLIAGRLAIMVFLAGIASAVAGRATWLMPAGNDHCVPNVAERFPFAERQALSPLGDKDRLPE
jgi:uncharacterized membrane protein